MRLLSAFLVAALISSTPTWAGEADVVSVKALKTGGTWRFDVTVRHDDTGWDHYADGWGVYTLDGTQLGYRELLHPHVDEQPFTRSLGGVKVPDGVNRVVIRAHDNVHGNGGREVAVELK
jgi:hypothetical protein